MRSAGSQTKKTYMPSWAKGMGVGLWDTKQEKDNPQEGGQSKCLLNKCWSYYAETVGHIEDFDSRPSLAPLLALHN